MKSLFIYRPGGTAHLITINPPDENAALRLIFLASPTRADER